MEMEHSEPPENIASVNYKAFITGLVGFELTSIKMMFTQPLTDRDNPFWAMGEEQGHQVHRSSSTKGVLQGGSQVAPSACKRLVMTTHCLILKATACFQGVIARIIPRSYSKVLLPGRTTESEKQFASKEQSFIISVSFLLAENGNES